MQNPCYLLTIHAIINKYARYALHRKREKENFVSERYMRQTSWRSLKPVWFQADDKENVNQIFIITFPPEVPTDRWPSQLFLYRKQFIIYHKNWGKNMKRLFL